MPINAGLNEFTNGNQKQSQWVTLGLALYGVSTLFSMAAMSIGALICLLCIGIGLATSHRFKSEIQAEWEQKEVRAYGVVAIALFAACALSLLVAAIDPVTYLGKASEVHFFRDMAKSWYLFWPLVLVLGLRFITQVQRTQVLKVWLIAFGILSIVGIFQYYTGWPRPQVIPGNEPRHHATLFLGHHLSVASIFIFPFFACLDLLWKQSKKAGLPRTVLAIFALTGLITLWMTYSRTLWVALPIGLCVWAMLRLPRKWAFIAVGGVALIALGVTQVPVIKQRLNAEIGIGPRQQLWQANWEFLKARPWTGVGWQHNQELSYFYFQQVHPGDGNFIGHAHNIFLEVIAGTGVIGLLAWLAWVGNVFMTLVRRIRVSDLASGWFAAWIVFLINGLTQVNFWESKVLHQVMWVMAWILVDAQNERSEALK